MIRNEMDDKSNSTSTFSFHKTAKTEIEINKNTFQICHKKPTNKKMAMLTVTVISVLLLFLPQFSFRFP